MIQPLAAAEDMSAAKAVMADGIKGHVSVAVIGERDGKLRIAHQKEKLCEGDAERGEGGGLVHAASSPISEMAGGARICEHAPPADGARRS